MLTPASDVIESALSASCTSRFPPALIMSVAWVDVIPEAPLAASVPEYVPLTPVMFPVVIKFPLLSTVTKFVVPPAFNA
jgi:hypothetical protein